MDKKTAQNLIDKTRKDYNSIAAQFSSTRSYNWPDVEAAIKKLGLKKGDKVLDLGCGNGRLIKVLENYDIEYTGLDISEQLIEYAKKTFTKYEFVVSDLVRTPFKKDEFDMVISIATLHHLPGNKRNEALQEINRILKPDGKVLISVWYFWNKPEFLKEIFSEAWQKVIGKSKLDFGDFYKSWKDGGREITKRYFHAWTKTELKRRLKLSSFHDIQIASSDTIEEKRNLIVTGKK